METNHHFIIKKIQKGRPRCVRKNQFIHRLDKSNNINF